MALILDGVPAAAALRERLAIRVTRLRAAGVVPQLVLLRVGADRSSGVYVRAKEKAAAEIGIASQTLRFAADVSPDLLYAEITRLNAASEVHGILLQLPLPDHLAQEELLATISPAKDVDGFHPINVGRLCLGLPSFVAATPLGIVRLLEHYAIPVAGKRVVILGRSRIVGRPLANLLSSKGPCGDATVTLCHSRTRDLAKVAREAEILIAAIGKPRFVTEEMVSPGCIVIDVGYHSQAAREAPGGRTICGDVDFEGVRDRVGAVTPVPGGVGPMTVACLLENTVQAAEAGSVPPH